MTSADGSAAAAGRASTSAAGSVETAAVGDAASPPALSRRRTSASVELRPLIATDLVRGSGTGTDGGNRGRQRRGGFAMGGRSAPGMFDDRDCASRMSATRDGRSAQMLLQLPSSRPSLRNSPSHGIANCGATLRLDEADISILDLNNNNKGVATVPRAASSNGGKFDDDDEEDGGGSGGGGRTNPRRAPSGDEVAIPPADGASRESCYIGPEGFRLKIPPANSRLLIEQKSYSTPGPFIEGKTWQSLLSSTHKGNRPSSKLDGRYHGPVQLLRRRKPEGNKALKTSESWNTVVHDRWSNQVRQEPESEGGLFSWLLSFAPEEDPVVFALFFVLGMMMMGFVFVYIYLILVLIEKAQGGGGSGGGGGLTAVVSHLLPWRGG